MTDALTYIPPETYVLGDVIQKFRKLQRKSWDVIVSVVLAEFESHPQFKMFGIEDLSNFAREAKSIEPSESSLCLLLDKLYKYFGYRAGVKFARWGDKTPYNTFFLKEIYRVFPNSKFVYVYRDGCDVVSSYVKAGIYEDIEKAATRWVDSNIAVLNFQKDHSSIVFPVSYEELVNESETVVKKITGFLDLELRSINEEEKILKSLGDVNILAHHSNVMNEIEKNNIGKGRKNLTRDQKIVLSKIMDDLLVNLGYQRCSK